MPRWRKTTLPPMSAATALCFCDVKAKSRRSKSTCNGSPLRQREPSLAKVHTGKVVGNVCGCVHLHAFGGVCVAAVSKYTHSILLRSFGKCFLRNWARQWN